MDITTDLSPPFHLIAGLGNLLLMDDGVGVHAVRAVAADPPPGSLCADVGTAILGSLHLLEVADGILILDAVQAGGPPGTVYEMDAADAEEADRPLSLHEMGLASALRFLDRPKPRAMRVLGIEPAKIDYGLEPTPAVAESLPRLVARARAIVASWGPPQLVTLPAPPGALIGSEG